MLADRYDACLLQVAERQNHGSLYTSYIFLGSVYALFRNKVDIAANLEQTLLSVPIVTLNYSFSTKDVVLRLVFLLFLCLPPSAVSINLKSNRRNA
ncbi:hypothetical protein GGR51DRAFT_522095 [Nemania sp. FL0031]|nr:hypothetical protein GGR51DRAFT_522095 [Nemania sp. FL0031]